MRATQAVEARLSALEGSAVFSGFLAKGRDALGDDGLVFVTGGAAYRADDVVYGEDGSWAKAGEIVLASYLADGTHDTGSLADEFVSMMSDRPPLVDRSRLDTIWRERCRQLLERCDADVEIS